MIYDKETEKVKKRDMKMERSKVGMHKKKKVPREPIREQKEKSQEPINYNNNKHDMVIF